ncbi:MAG: glycoside hydrolase family 127 protein [Firmicutes bacterium]|nr:glycoside hydrolase family 127 protein [Bacillota bacterium]
MKNIAYDQVRITGGFWKTKQEMLLNTSRSVYDRFAETYRFEAENVKGWLDRLLAEGSAASTDRPRVPHIFWDSDVAKWIEGTAYLIKIAQAWDLTPDQQDELLALEQICDDTIDTICENADENGYFNSHFQITEALGEARRFTDRSQHELYCAGHLIEAALAYQKATGKDKLLRQMIRYADYIDRVFHIENSAVFETPGHPELELALVKLAHFTEEEKYLDLAKWFIDHHGDSSKDIPPYDVFNNRYNQDEMPLRKRTTADGHSVRAMYLLSGMIDVAARYQDASLMDACRRLYDNVVNHRMYITGGIGSTHIGEAFTIDYHLPSRTAYSETCAAIALAQVCGRMIGASTANTGEDGPAVSVPLLSSYADTLERTMYNGILSGISLDGTGFFYENPLTIDLRFNDPNVSTKDKEYYPETTRRKVFSCSCCPPNVLRFYASLGDYLYSVDEDTLYVHQYMESEASLPSLKVCQKTDYPASGRINLTIRREDPAIRRIALRLPSWCEHFKLYLPYEQKNGYLYVDLSDETTIELDLGMPIRFVSADPRVHDALGKVAVSRGPVIYALEGKDQPDIDIHRFLIDPSAGASPGPVLSGFLLPSIEAEGVLPLPYEDSAAGDLFPGGDRDTELYRSFDPSAFRKVRVRLIPYYAFANRGSSDLTVWIRVK